MLSRIIFAAGGTGGHIYPALAVADELKKINENINICFIGAKGKMEEKVVPEYGYLLKTINISGLIRSLNTKNLWTALKLFSSVKEARSLLKGFAPDIVFGTGGYASGPVVWSASKLKIPVVLYEGNYYPGLTVRFLASRANAVLVNFPESEKFFKHKNKIKSMSYPVRKKLKIYSRNEAIIHFNLISDKKTLFIFGGSQGAHSINKAFLKCFDKLTVSNIQILWQTGEKDYDEVFNAVTQNPDIKIFKFLNEIDFAYSAADLIVCRSGISAVMEIAYFGAAAIFVPYPFASEAHQLMNAEKMYKQNAAELILDKNLDIQMESKIIKLINDKKKLNEMRANIKRFSDVNAASKIAGYLNNFNLFRKWK